MTGPAAVTGTSSTFRVGKDSDPRRLAGAIARLLREGRDVELDAIGAGAVGQAVKGIAIARTYVADDELDLSCRPRFEDREIDGNQRTAMVLAVRAESARTVRLV